jgi:hypothetical protein
MDPEQGKGFALFEERFQAANDNTRDFDPTIIITILAALIPLIQQCLANRPSALRRRLLNRPRVVVAIRRERPDLSWSDASKLADQCFDLADKASDAELKLFIKDCCG